ncbi:hypothetical protein [Minwuia sp.]|uniref:hypothetical protein n=1 Tax=Minwuia sp. TaxID=2493630 RepID=UPI003A9182AC
MTMEAEIGALRADVNRLKTDVALLERENRELRGLLNRGRGAVWVIGVTGATATFLLTQWRNLVELVR